jgi:L-threonylcarbamoyladenylate synthase
MIDEPVNSQVIVINPLFPEPEKIETAAAVLRQGGLVAFPTETVYGIGADYRNERAKERLYRIKNRPKDKPFTLLIAKLDQVKNVLGIMPEAAVKISETFWPGPLTVVLESIEGLKCGFRMPDHRVALDLINACGAPLFAPSANLTGQPPALNAEEVLKTFNGKVEMILDGGKVLLGKESTVLDLTTAPYKILREGAVSLTQLQKAGQIVTVETVMTGVKTLLFVCTGNSCRSAMAEGLFKEMLKGKKTIEVISAGIGAIPGLSAARGAEVVMKEIGIDISSHRTRMLTLEMAEKADLILAMALLHKEYIEMTYPEFKEKVHLLTEYGNPQKPLSADIPDPVGRPLEAYEECLRVMREHLERVVNLI